MPIRILVADDHLAVAESFRALLEQQGWDARVAQSPDEAEAVLQTWTPDIALLDIEFRGSEQTGFDVARTMARICPKARVVFISMHNDSVFPEYARKAGAAGFLVKTVSSAEMIQAIRTVSGGGECYPGTKHSRPSGLPPQGLEVVRHLAQGLRDKAIARAMGITPRTVLHHIREAEKLTGAKTRIELVDFVRQRGWFLLPAPPPGGGR